MALNLYHRHLVASTSGTRDAQCHWTCITGIWWSPHLGPGILSGTESTPQASGGLHTSHHPQADSPTKHLTILLSTTLSKKEIAGKHIIEKVKGDSSPEYIPGPSAGGWGSVRRKHVTVMLYIEVCSHSAEWLLCVPLFAVSCELSSSVKSADRGSEAIIWHLGAWRGAAVKNTVGLLQPMHTLTINSPGP